MNLWIPGKDLKQTSIVGSSEENPHRLIQEDTWQNPVYFKGSKV
jgi:hypothetical protein